VGGQCDFGLFDERESGGLILFVLNIDLVRSAIDL